MSSKLNVKASKRERPKSSDKLRKGKRDGTPEKPTTPNASQDTLQEEGTPQPEKKQVLINDEILGLAIKLDDLSKLHEPKPPSAHRKTPATAAVIVRKLKPASEWNKPPPKMVTVARPAPPDSELKPFNPADGVGIRFDDSGRVVPHSILGSVENYIKMALQDGHLPKDYAIRSDELQPTTLTPKYEKKPKVTTHPCMQSVDESNALRNWQLQMMERKRQQGHISKLLDRPPEQLVMNQSDMFRQTQEQRYLVDHIIHCMDNGRCMCDGKGFRKGSEFWKQQELIGDDLTGIHMTNNKTEQGYPPPIEHVGVPRTILEEKGTDFAHTNPHFNKPWHKSTYLHERMQQLQPVIDELVSHRPELTHLEVIGVPHDRITVHRKRNTSALSMLSDDSEEQGLDAITEEDLDPLSEYPDVCNEPVRGPSILFAGQPARWTGDSQHMTGHVGIEARVTFEAYANYRSTSFLEIVNDGSTVIWYDWKKLPKSNPFELVNHKVQRFYFNNFSGVILPGNTIKFPFTFKSPYAGVFTEQWEFQTHPVVCGGAALVVTLRGVALQEDKFKKQRSELDLELAHRQAVQVVSSILDAILDGIRSPERPSSPLDAFITVDEIFEKKNPGLYYHNEEVTDLTSLYKQLFPDEEREHCHWDLDVRTLKQCIMGLDDEDERKQDFLHKLNAAIIAVSFPAITPIQKTMYTACYGLLCEAVDGIVEQCHSIRSMLGMPDKDADELADEPRSLSDDESVHGDGKKSGGGRAASKLEAKDKKVSGRDSKQPPKTPGSREALKPGGKITPGQKRPTTREERAPSPPSGAGSPGPTGLDPVLCSKYKEKIYNQTYQMLSETLDKIDEAFSQALLVDGGPKQLQL